MGFIDKSYLSKQLESLADRIAAVFARKKDHNIATYHSLEQLGLTAPATITEIYDAIPARSNAVLTKEEVSNDPTNGNGATFWICKHGSHRGFVLASGKTTGLYIMHLAEDGGVSGTWEKITSETI